MHMEVGWGKMQKEVGSKWKTGEERGRKKKNETWRETERYGGKVGRGRRGAKQKEKEGTKLHGCYKRLGFCAGMKVGEAEQAQR